MRVCGPCRRRRWVRRRLGSRRLASLGSRCRNRRRRRRWRSLRARGRIWIRCDDAHVKSDGTTLTIGRARNDIRRERVGAGRRGSSNGKRDGKFGSERLCVSRETTSSACRPRFFAKRLGTGAARRSPADPPFRLLLEFPAPS